MLFRQHSNHFYIREGVCKNGYRGMKYTLAFDGQELLRNGCPHSCPLATGRHYEIKLSVHNANLKNFTFFR